MSTISTQSPSEVAEQLTKQGVQLIDVRTPVEFRELHAVGAKNVPLDTLNPKELLATRNGDSDEPLYFICKSGSRGEMACKKLHAAGFTNVINVAGGSEAWAQVGLPVNRGKKAVSLERQVRITAGVIVLIGALLALFVNPYFAAIPAFVGAGLAFAGITDTCAMGMMIAKMPWNQVKNDECCSV